jgi:hypothetical protein
VHVEHQGGGAVAPSELVGDGRVLGEAGAEAAEAGRHHQPEQPRLPEILEVVDGEHAVAVVPSGAGGEARHQPGRGGQAIRHDSSLVPIALVPIAW